MAETKPNFQGYIVNITAALLAIAVPSTIALLINLGTRVAVVEEHVASHDAGAKYHIANIGQNTQRSTRNDTLLQILTTKIGFFEAQLVELRGSGGKFKRFTTDDGDSLRKRIVQLEADIDALKKAIMIIESANDCTNLSGYEENS